MGVRICIMKYHVRANTKERTLPPNMATFHVRHLAPAAICIAVLWLSGCANTGRQIGEEKLNSFVGKPIAGTYLETSPYVEKIEGSDVTRYLQKSKYGCDIEFVVENKTKRVLSWQYLSSASQCWQSKGSF